MPVPLSCPRLECRNQCHPGRAGFVRSGFYHSHDEVQRHRCRTLSDQSELLHGGFGCARRRYLSRSHRCGPQGFPLRRYAGGWARREVRYAYPPTSCAICGRQINTLRNTLLDAAVSALPQEHVMKSGWADSNRRPQVPQTCTLTSCATARSCLNEYSRPYHARRRRVNDNRCFDGGR